MSNYQLIKNTEWKEVEINGEDKEIPVDWEVASFIKKEEFISGVTIDKQELRNDFNNGDTFFLRANNIEESGNVNFNNLYYISTEIKPTQYLKEKDILICLASGSKNLVGKTSLVKFLPNKSTIGSFCGIIRTENFFKYYLTRGYEYKNWLNQFEATSIFNLKRENLLDYKCSIPPLAQQSAIASILSEQESVIENIEQLIQKYESRFQYLSDELLSGRLRVKEVDGEMVLYKNPDDNWKEVEVNGEMKEIPSDWEVDKIKDIAEFKNGYAFNKEDLSEIKTDNKLLKIGNISLSKKYIAESNNQIYLKNTNSNFELFNEDLIIAMDDLTPDVSFIGTTAIINEKSGRLFQNQRLGSIHPKNINKNYLNFQINNNQYIFAKIATGSTAKNLSKPMIENFEIRVSNKNEQFLISNILIEQKKLIDLNFQILSQEKQKFDWLLDNLLSGKYLVKEI